MPGVSNFIFDIRRTGKIFYLFVLSKMILTHLANGLPCFPKTSAIPVVIKGHSDFLLLELIRLNFELLKK